MATRRPIHQTGGGGRDEMAGSTSTSKVLGVQGLDERTSDAVSDQDHDEKSVRVKGSIDRVGTRSTRRDQTISAAKSIPPSRSKRDRDRLPPAALSSSVEEEKGRDLATNYKSTSVTKGVESKDGGEKVLETPKGVRKGKYYVSSLELRALGGESSTIGSLGAGLRSGTGTGSVDQKKDESNQEIGAGKIKSRGEETESHTRNEDSRDFERDRPAVSRGDTGSVLRLRSGDLKNSGSAVRKPATEKGIVESEYSGQTRSKLRRGEGQSSLPVESPASERQSFAIANDKSAVSGSKSRRGSEVELLRKDLPLGFEEVTVGEASPKRTAQAIRSSSSTQPETVQRSDSRRSSEVERLRESQSIQPVEKPAFGAGEKGPVSRSKSRQDSQVPAADESQLGFEKSQNESRNQRTRADFARPPKRKASTLDNEELEELSKTGYLRFHHLNDQLPSSFYRSGTAKITVGVQVFKNQVGTPFQTPRGLEEGSGRSLRSVTNPPFKGVNGVTSILDTTRDSIEVDTLNSKTKIARSRSQILSSRSRVISKSQTEASSEIEDSIEVEAPPLKVTVPCTKSEIVLPRSKLPLGDNEDSIRVEPPKAKLKVARAKSRIGLSRSEAVPNLLEKRKSSIKVLEDSSKSKETVERLKLKVAVPVPHTTSRGLSFQSESSSTTRTEKGAVAQSKKRLVDHKSAASESGLPLTETTVNLNSFSKSQSSSHQTVGPVKGSAHTAASKVLDLPDSDSKLPPNTICITKYLGDEDIKQIMPDLDESVLTRARRRAEGPQSDRLISRRRSSSHKITGQQRVNLVNGTRAVSAVAESPSSQLLSKPASPNYIQVDTTQSILPSKPEESISKETSKAKTKEKPLERNIDNVIFAEVTFKAWYPSWYPKEIIGEKGLNGDCKGIVVPDLYVCKKCFGYSKSVVEWVRHTRCCEKEIPGEKVYTHGPEGIWSVWEVDGDIDTLFCQNLSLFAKLFLDNKSVFFDVSGFKYFLLVHTSPLTQSTQVVGFFSKEKMSWDNNNLACILVFPPWQRKSLGTLLMGISYAISKRERILGGPEKPISDLGKKGYRRYWGAEIARWLLEVKESDKKKGRGMVTVGEVSQGTWIVAEDCLQIMREMGVVERAGRGKGIVERVRVDKEAVRRWVVENGIKLERVVDEEGFEVGYAMVDDEEVVEDIVMEG